MNQMYLYSGKCRLGTVGQPTPFKDALGNELFVGDIVIVYTDDYGPESLTAVVSDEFTSYSDGEHRVKEGPIKPFVMGIKSVDLAEPGTWKVRRVKKHQDVVDGEHWTAYGFSYHKELPA